MSATRQPWPVSDLLPLQALPVRFLRSVINRFWGGGDAGNEDDSDEEGNQLRDLAGVD